MHFPFDELELENYLLRLQNALLATSSTRRRIGSPSEGAVEEFGTALYEALLSGNIRTCYELSRREAQVQDKGLRIKMRLEDPALAVLPWEFLYDRGKGEFVALSRYSPVVRYIDTESVTQPLRVAPPIRILGMIASPSDLPPLNVEREKQRVERAVAALQENGHGPADVAGGRQLAGPPARHAARAVARLPLRRARPLRRDDGGGRHRTGR